MRCIFCKENSDNQKSQEHIIPESLGNTEHVLPPGWVCDKCNNYLSRKVEAPFLNSENGKRLRFEMLIPSKKGRIPTITGVHPQSRSLVNLTHDGNNLGIYGADAKSHSKLINSFQTQRRGSLIVPAAIEPPLSYELARFIGMVALEVFALKSLNIPNSNNEIVDNVRLDELRNYIRRGRRDFVWPIHIRRIYPARQQFADQVEPCFEILHEWNILFIPDAEGSCSGVCYAVIIILGVEYTINLGGPELDGYLKWLKEHSGKCYLYSK